ncbi:MAG: hypothetical protein ACRDBY_03940 [Cetobacterium sp.]
MLEKNNEIEYIKNNNIDDNNYVIEYYKKNSSLEKMYNYLINVTNETLVCGYGDLNSKLVIILRDKSCDYMIEVYKKTLEFCGLYVSSAYITYLCKSSNMELNFSALKKELEILSQDKIVLMNGFNIQQIPYNNVFVDCDKYKPYLTNSCKKEEMEALKLELWNIIYPSIKWFCDNKN